MNFLSAIMPGQLTNIVIYALVIAIIWFALRLILRIAHRVFVFGCGAILVFALLLILLRFLGH